MNISELIEAFSSTRILCVGDVMLDQFVKGGISRISPEAPVPIIRIQEKFSILGGAGNVARNLEALGGNVTFLSVIGQDQEGKKIEELFKELPNVKAFLLKDKTRTTTKKTRFIASNQQILRVDQEEVQPLLPSDEKNLITIFKNHLSSHDLVILSDYAKGFFSPPLLKCLIQEARSQGKPILVDPKGADYSVYKGATLVTPNAHEVALSTFSDKQTQDEMIATAQNIVKNNEFKAMVVTQGAQGMTCIEANGAVSHLPTQALEVFDVSGAGDTVIAMLGICLAAGETLSHAITLANKAAGLVVAKVGTAVVHQEELLAALHQEDLKDYDHKTIPMSVAQEMLHKWKLCNQRIVFTNGCFDLLHPGHISLLKKARSAGDRLVVGLNSDASVKRLKGESRPIQNEVARAFVLSSLEFVDLVLLFEEDTPLNLIQMIKPDVLVKGADYSLDQVVGASFVQRYGGEVLLIDLVQGQSTSQIVSKIVA